MDALQPIVFVFLLGVLSFSAVVAKVSKHPLAIREVTLGSFDTSAPCLFAGIQCTSCSQLSLCVSSSSGFVEYPLEECNALVGEYCSPSLKKCHSRKSSCSLNWDFWCREAGTFPDPFDCNRFHVCTYAEGEMQAEERTCSAGSAYNAKTTQCDLKDTDPICEGYPVPECPSSGVIASPLSQNANIYYVCQGGLPQFFKCLEGEDYVFDPDLYACVQKDDDATTLSPTTTTNEPEPEGCIPDVKYYVPHTCESAYYCFSGRQYLISCKYDRLYFDRELRYCKVGTCPYDVAWHLACPTQENRPVPGTCNLYYNCMAQSEGDGESLMNCRSGYFDRETLACAPGDCPYSHL